MNHAAHNFGFTLIELILVMVIMATVMALAAPSLRTWGRGAELRDAADNFITATRWARSQAAADGKPYAVVIDRQNESFSVKTLVNQKLTDVDSTLAHAVSLPEGASIQAVTSGNTAVDQIVFHPTGRLDPARVTITSAAGDSVTIQALTPVDDFVVAEQRSNSR